MALSHAFLMVASLGLLLHSPRFAAVTEQHILRFVNTNFANDLALAIDHRLDRLQQISVPATVEDTRSSSPNVARIA
jgi:hypothetical protein